LLPYASQFETELWTVLQDPQATRSRRLRAAGALAEFSPRDPRWQEHRDEVVDWLIAENPLSLRDWIENFRPVALLLLEPLKLIFQQGETREVREAAALCLGEYLADSNDRLLELVRLAEPEQLPVLAARLTAHRHDAIPRLEAELRSEPDPNASEVEKDRAARRQANAALVLLHLGEEAPVWPQLRHREDPRLATYIMHGLAPAAVESQLAIRQLTAATATADRRYAALLGLGGYSAANFSATQRRALLPVLQLLYERDPDPGVHSAAEWLLRKWSFTEELAELKARVATAGMVAGRDWYVSRQGFTFAVIRGPVEFWMGSPETEAARFDRETRHRRRISRTFAIATTPVTVEQFRRFRPSHASHEASTLSPDSPVTMGELNEAMLYCAWLSEQEGLPADQHPYQLTRQKNGRLVARPHPDFLQRTGYRLVTEGEWEYACRAGTTTVRFYGHDLRLLSHYVWHRGNAGGLAYPVGLLCPNRLGGFDFLGNRLSFCQDTYAEYPTGSPDAVFEDLGLWEPGTQLLVVQRGSHSGRTDPWDHRVAYRGKWLPQPESNSTFRVARTLPAP
jgi:eukaryotic-like serine/threonine-protein kinase